MENNVQPPTSNPEKSEPMKPIVENQNSNTASQPKPQPTQPEPGPSTFKQGFIQGFKRPTKTQKFVAYTVLSVVAISLLFLLNSMQHH